MIDQAMEATAPHPKDATAPLQAVEDEATVHEAPLVAGVGLPKSRTEVLAPRTTQADRARQILGAIRPFLPVVGGALRMFDHGAAQAASRLLPLLAGSGPAAAPSKSSSDEEAGLALLASLEKERNAMRADLDLCKEQLRSHEERLVKLREALTRTLADHDGMQRSLKQLTDRNRLLTAGVVILLMLMIAGVVLFEVNVHHG